MSNLKNLARDTVIYGASSIIGRFLNYLLVPLYTHRISAESGGYGIVTNLYAYTALLLVFLTFAMETTFFRFANKEGENPHTVFSTAFSVITPLSLTFLAAVFLFQEPLCAALGYADHPEFVLMMATVVTLDALQTLPFCHLRFARRPIKFASLKLLFIALNISLNLLFFVVLGFSDVFYVFALNLVCTAIITFFFLPDLMKVKWKFDLGLLRRMLVYALPLVVLDLAGILNQAFDKIAYPLIDTTLGGHSFAEANQQLGVYGACVKIAMIMAMITQAFRYAYEPLVFSIAGQKDSKRSYALGMKYFIIFTLLAFLAVMAYLDVLKLIIGPQYREGLKVVPIVMVAEMMMGVYFNLSFWYKLIDKTIWGAYISLTGCAVLVLTNILFIPAYSYMACAWAGVAGYGTAMLLSYFIGQRKNPIDYPLKEIGLYVGLTAVLFLVMRLVPGGWPIAVRLVVNTLLVVVFLAYVVKTDLPLASLPVVGKYFRK